MDNREDPAIYVIRIHGVLGDRLLAAFAGMDARTDRGNTVLTGPLPDQPALHALLGEIEALGLELLGVQRT